MSCKVVRFDCSVYDITVG